MNFILASFRFLQLSKTTVFYCFLFLSFSSFFSTSIIAQPQPEITFFKSQINYSQGEFHTDIKVDSDGIIWIVQIGNVIKYDGKSFTKIVSDEFQHSSFIKFHESPSGKKYVIDFSNQLFHIEEDTLRPYLLNDSLKKLNKNNFCYDFYFDQKERLHLSLAGGRYLIIDSNRIESVHQGLLAPLNGFIGFLQKDHLPFLIPKGRKGSLFFYLVNEEGIVDSIPISPYSDLQNPSIIQLQDSNYLMATGRGHLIEFNDTGIIQQFETGIEGGIIGLLEDTDGGLWISTKSGIRYYENGELKEGNYQLILPNTFSIAVQTDFQGGIWIQSTKHGLGRIINKQNLLYSQESGSLHSNSLKKISIANSKLYAGTHADSFITVVDLKTNEHSLKSIPNPTYALGSISYDSIHKRLWIARRGYLSYTDNEQWKYLNVDETLGSGKGFMFTISQSQFSKKVFGIWNRQFFQLKDTVIDNISPKFPSRVLNLLNTGDSSWVTTASGVCLLKEGKIIEMKNQHEPLGNYFKFMGAFANKIWFISHRNRHSYMLTEKGLSEIRINNKPLGKVYPLQISKDEFWFFSNTASYRLLSSAEPNHEMGINLSRFPPIQLGIPKEALYNPSDSSIFWVTDDKGILKTQLKDIRSKKFIAPQLHIRKVEINNDSFLGTDSIFQLKHDQNSIRISYVGINYSDFEVQYRYRMPGINDSWKLTSEGSIQFLELPPGNYSLELQTQLVGQLWSPSKTLQFTIVPPIWGRWWFLALMILFAVILIYQILHYRLGVQNREKTLVINQLRSEQKALRAKMDPHFIFNVLTSLQYLISHNLNEKAALFLDKFSRLMRGTLDQISTDFISIKDEIFFLEEYLELESIRFEGKFEYDIKIESGLNTDQKIPNLLIQPLVENAILHGLKNKNDGKGLLQLTLKKEGQFLKVSVIDNGVGYKRTKEANKNRKVSRKSYGMQTIRDRLVLHNNNKKINSFAVLDLSLTDRKSSGSMVNIMIKLIK